MVLTPPLHVHRPQRFAPHPSEGGKSSPTEAHLLPRAGEGCGIPSWGVPDVPSGGDWRAVVPDWGMRALMSPFQCPWRQGLVCGAVAGPPLCAPLPRQATLPPRVFLAMETLTPIPSVLFAQQTVVLSLDLLSQPHNLALSPCQHWWLPVSGRRGQD